MPLEVIVVITLTETPEKRSYLSSKVGILLLYFLLISGFTVLLPMVVVVSFLEWTPSTPLKRADRQVLLL